MPLVLGISFFLVVQAAGYCIVRLVRLHDGLVGLGLGAPVGLAVLAVLTTGSTLGGLPVLATALIAGVPVVGGTLLAIRSLKSPTSMIRCGQSRGALLLLLVG